MTPLDNLTSAFECLWETKIYLMRTMEGADEETQSKARALHREVAVTRDRVQALLIELLGKHPPAADQPKA